MAAKIHGTVRKVNGYADGTPTLEIHVPRNRAEGLPFHVGARVPITLRFAGIEYDAGLRATERNDYVWVSPTLRSVNGTRTTLGRVLTEGGLRPNDPLILVVEDHLVSVETDHTVDVRHALSSEQQPSGARDAVTPRIHSRPTGAEITMDRPITGPSKSAEATPIVLPPIPDSEALITRIRSLAGLPERNHEDVVKELLLRLGFDASEIVFQKGRIDLCVLTQDRKTAAVFEVKRTIAVESERAGARRQGMDYASQTGAMIIVVTDGDRFEIYDRRKGHDYDAMLCGAFRLTAFHDTDAMTLDLLRPDNLRSART